MTAPLDTKTITVNGDVREVPVGYALTEVLRDLDIDPDYATGVAVAVNNEVIPREAWDDVTLEVDDTVEVIQAQQGG